MNKFTSGLLTGGIIGAIGLTYALSDRKMRKKVARDGKRIMHKATDMMDNMDW